MGANESFTTTNSIYISKEANASGDVSGDLINNAVKVITDEGNVYAPSSSLSEWKRKHYKSAEGYAQMPSASSTNEKKKNIHHMLIFSDTKPISEQHMKKIMHFSRFRWTN